MNKLRLSWPNRITVGRILLIGPFVISILYMNEKSDSDWPRYCALIIFFIMALSDALDGWLARRNHMITSLGKFLDPLADKLLITCACLLLATPTTAVPGTILPKMVVVLILGKDLYTILGFLIIYLVTSEIKIVPVYAGKITTALQLVMVLSILISPDATALWADFPFLVRILWWSASGMAIITMIVYTRNGTRFLNEYEQQQRRKLTETEK